MMDFADTEIAPPGAPPAPDPLAMTERAIRLLQEDSERPTVATALALLEQIRDFLKRTPANEA